jgi:hypothetical protein
MKYTNVYDVNSGALVKVGESNNKDIKKWLEMGFAVEIYDGNDNPISNYVSKYFYTDRDGFAIPIK